MMRSFMTSLPEQPGAFLQASRIILAHGGNMTRASYNKAVDAHMLFVDVEADGPALKAIEQELTEHGFLRTSEHVKVLLMAFELPDVPGSTIPVLEVLEKYNINISYLSCQSAGTATIELKMGLYIENSGVIDDLLKELSALCPVQILSYDAGEKKLDNTVFYLTLADEMRKLLDLSQEQTQQFIYYTNLAMQQLDDKGEPHGKTFEYVSRFAHFVADHGGSNYDCRLTAQKLTDRVNATVIEPPCGSNITVLEDGATGALLVVDGGFTCYEKQTMQLLRMLFPGFDNRRREMLLSHSDSDHTGICAHFDVIWCTRRTGDCFAVEHMGLPCPREENRNMMPYYHLSKIITDYEPPRTVSLKFLDENPGDDAEPLSAVGHFLFADMDFTVWQGNGGHVPGETVLTDEKHRVALTGDDYINVHNMIAPQRTFNQLAPYLARSVNQNSARYRKILLALKEMLDDKGWLIFPGHGAPLQRDQHM